MARGALIWNINMDALVLGVKDQSIIHYKRLSHQKSLVGLLEPLQYDLYQYR